MLFKIKTLFFSLIPTLGEAHNLVWCDKTEQNHISRTKSVMKNILYCIKPALGHSQHLSTLTVHRLAPVWLFIKSLFSLQQAAQHEVVHNRMQFWDNGIILFSMKTFFFFKLLCLRRTEWKISPSVLPCKHFCSFWKSHNTFQCRVKTQY